MANRNSPADGRTHWRAMENVFYGQVQAESKYKCGSEVLEASWANPVDPLLNGRHPLVHGFWHRLVFRACQVALFGGLLDPKYMATAVADRGNVVDQSSIFSFNEQPMAQVGKLTEPVSVSDCAVFVHLSENSHDCE